LEADASTQHGDDLVGARHLPQSVEHGEEESDIEDEDDDLGDAGDVEKGDGVEADGVLCLDEIGAVIPEVDNEPDGQEAEETEEKGGSETPDDVAVEDGRLPVEEDDEGRAE